MQLPQSIQSNQEKPFENFLFGLSCPDEGGVPVASEAVHKPFSQLHNFKVHKLGLN